MSREFIPRLRVSRKTFEAVRTKQQTIFVSTDDRMFVRFQVGRRVRISTDDERSVTCIVTAIRRFESLDALLKAESLTALCKGDRPAAERVLERIFPELPEHHTFVALEIRLVPRKGRS